MRSDPGSFEDHMKLIQEVIGLVELAFSRHVDPEEDAWRHSLHAFFWGSDVPAAFRRVKVASGARQCESIEIYIYI